MNGDTYMKVGIVTFHFVNNFGGALQAYALQKAVMKRCAITSVKLVDYRNWFIRFTDTVRLFPITGNMVELKTGLKTMKQRFNRLKRFRKFCEDNCDMTRYYRNGMSLRLYPPDCDKYILGSDQIWNPVLTGGVADPYFGGFEKDSKNKFSYAPSFGNNNIHRFFKNRVRRYLLSLGSISVREKEGKNLVEALTGRKAVQLIDPSFLLERNEWDEIAVKPDIKGKYILVYIMQRDNSIYEYARKLKAKLGIQLVEISRYGYKPDFIDISLIDVGPCEFVGLFQNAACICTNSYHGLSFSLIFQKDLYLIQCKRFKGRINNLLDLLHINIPELLSSNDPQCMLYDKERVEEIVIQERKKAFEYIRRNLEKQ